MDKDYRFIQDHIMEAQRLRNEALGQLLESGWHAATDAIGRALRALRALPAVLRSRQPLHH